MCRGLRAQEGPESRREPGAAAAVPARPPARLCRALPAPPAAHPPEASPHGRGKPDTASSSGGTPGSPQPHGHRSLRGGERGAPAASPGMLRERHRRSLGPPHRGIPHGNPASPGPASPGPAQGNPARESRIPGPAREPRIPRPRIPGPAREPRIPRPRTGIPHPRPRTGAPHPPAPHRNPASPAPHPPAPHRGIPHRNPASPGPAREPRIPRPRIPRPRIPRPRTGIPHPPAPHPRPRIPGPASPGPARESRIPRPRIPGPAREPRIPRPRTGIPHPPAPHGNPASPGPAGARLPGTRGAFAVRGGSGATPPESGRETLSSDGKSNSSELLLDPEFRNCACFCKNGKLYENWN
ncbi:basic proline-rich protein-like [Molothrus aeneus]|uniref:basic proline-rich protein-like n=1 Tax=Molothrus aeneus TaxID=84833 RepID=UPI00345AC4DC